MNLDSFEDIIYVKEDNGICTITINRPERKNALSLQTFKEIKAVLSDIEQDSNAKVLIITGCKEAEAFSSGGYFSMKFFSSLSKEKKDNQDFKKDREIKFWDFTKPIIAVINGLAIGAAITMVLMGADLIYISENAWLEFPFIKRGIIAQSAMSFILPFYVGFQKAKEILYFGDKITAKEALKLGFVNAVLPPDELIPFARDKALKLIPPKGPSIAIKYMKNIIHRTYSECIFKTSELEKESNRFLFKTHDFRESTRAFIAKREPKFKGK